MRITVVVPIYQEEKNIVPLYERLEKVTNAIKDTQWEYIFVNDGSKDRSLVELKRLAAQDQKVRVIDLSRNFGKEIALTAGVNAVNSDAVICMDADLQHPPELIPKLIDHWKQGAEVVAAIRVDMDGQPLIRRICSFLYYWLMSKITKLDMAAKTTDFRLCDRKVVEAFRQFTEKGRMFRGIVDWLGFKKIYVEFHAPARIDGNVSYSYTKLWQLAVSSIMSFSLFPLKLTGYLGLIISIATGLLLIWMILADYVFALNHFTSLAMFVVLNTFLFGIVLMALGLVALYIGTIHTEVINRPLYIIRERINFPHPDTDSKHGS
jgi:glycosyltransferase involved in cell wall biosynthesis